MLLVGVAARGATMGKCEVSQKAAASISYYLPYSQIDIYLLFYEANCIPELLTILFLYIIRVEKYGVVLLRMCLRDL